MKSLLSLALIFSTSPIIAGEKDLPFLQDQAVKIQFSPTLQGAKLQRLRIDRNNVVFVLTDAGVARLFENELSLDRSYRPIAGMKAVDINLHQDELVYLFPPKGPFDGGLLLSNAFAGKLWLRIPDSSYQRFAFSPDRSVLLAGPDKLALVTSGQIRTIAKPFQADDEVSHLLWHHGAFWLLLNNSIYKVKDGEIELFHRGEHLTCMAFRGENEMVVGTNNGYFILDATSGKEILPLQTRLPSTAITCVVPVKDDLWFGTTRGAFRRTAEGRIDYYASRRWLPDDYAVDLAADRKGNMLILTQTGLAKICFTEMTLAQKAAHYQHLLRQRHIRNGFCAETRLLVSGDLTSTQLVDSDNDGLWSAMYMAAEAFRYAVTGSEDARRNAWETFASLERLERITTIAGFPARSFERFGLKSAERDIWHPTNDQEWDWKGTTSSDEIVGHFFGYAAIYECVAKSAEEKQRVAQLADRIMDHIVRNNWYLIDLDGKPTLWGKWSAEYLNAIPVTVGDRRLNSVEIIGFLQFAHKVTGKEIYKEQAMELLYRHGYLDNIMRSMSQIKFTDHPLGDEWNHSDDELAFLSYWLLHRYTFNDDLKRKFAETIRDHWEIESIEKNPLWNFIYAATGAQNFDLPGALWTLREFPLDMINWTVANSHRKDITPLPPNFRNQQSRELLPPDERPLKRWNGNPFTLDGGDNGYEELTGETFLLPYWMGRYLGCIVQ